MRIRRHRIAAPAALMLGASLATGACTADTQESEQTVRAGLIGSGAPQGVTPSRPIGAQSGASLSSPPSYFGGPVISPEIVTLYWGTFSDAQRTSMQAYLQGLATHLSGATAPAGLEPVTFQYGVYGATVGATAIDTNTPSQAISEGDIEAEIAALQANGTLPAYAPQRMILVFTDGITFNDGYGSSYCGYHHGVAANKYFALVPRPSVASCGSGGFGPNDQTAIWQSITSHEVLETATDPGNPGGTIAWAPEIGDPCNWGDDPANTVPMSFGAVQKSADRLQSACSIWTQSQLSQTSIASWGPNRLDVFAMSESHTALHKAWTGSAWVPVDNGWEDHGGTFTVPPTAISWGPNRVDFVGQGPGGKYYHQAWDGANWQPGKTDYEDHGGAFVGPPSLASWGAGRLDIFGRSTDGQMLHQAWDGTTWQPSKVGWEEHGGQLTGSPSAVSWGPNRVDIFVAGPDGAYYHQAWDGANWQPSKTTWEPHGAPPGVSFVSPPVVNSWGVGRLDVVGLGSDGAYYHQAWDGANWQPSRTTWERHDGVTFRGPPALASWGANRLDIVGQGTDGHYYHQAWDGARWQPAINAWENHQGTFTSGPATATWGTSRFSIFGPSTDQKEYVQSWTGSWFPAIDGWQPISDPQMIQ
jgi:hypothetical protein